MKILVTGAAGFIGSHVVDLLSKDHEILALDNLSTGKRENIDPKIQFAKCDITAFFDLLGEMYDFEPQAVIHLAAQSAIMTSIENPIRDAHHNIMGTLNVIHACQKMGINRLIFSSTSAVYNIHEVVYPLKETTSLKPESPYGISKLAAESYVRLQMPEGIILRFGNVYGPRQVPIGENQVIPRMIKHFKNGDQFFIHGDGKQKRDFVYVGDVARAVKAALTGNPGIYNIASRDSVSINELATMIESLYDLPGYQWMHTDTQDPRRDSCMDIFAASMGLDWKPEMNIEAGLKRTVEWWKAQ